MGRRKAKENEVLKYEIKTRVNEQKYQELQRILNQNPNMDMSTMVRNILHNRQLKVYTYDKTIDIIMEELAALRAEIRAIGININQITRHFNTYPDERKKQFYAKIALAEFIRTETKMDKAVDMISKLGKKWLLG